jgi:formate dehydrogenase subunit delta
MSMPDQSAHGEGTHNRSTNDKLVYMANQIGTFFLSQDAETAPAKIAEHIRKFWDPRMREAIVAHLDRGGTGLDPASRQAVESLRGQAAGA